MESEIVKLIKELDCSAATVKARQQTVRQILNRIKSGKASPKERKLLVDAMKNLKELSRGEAEKTTYNILLCYYFAENPMNSKQIANKFKFVNKTIFLYINKGIDRLTILLYGVGGICLEFD